MHVATFENLTDVEKNARSVRECPLWFGDNFKN